MGLLADSIVGVHDYRQLCQPHDHVEKDQPITAASNWRSRGRTACWVIEHGYQDISLQIDTVSGEMTMRDGEVPQAHLTTPFKRIYLKTIWVLHGVMWSSRKVPLPVLVCNLG